MRNISAVIILSALLSTAAMAGDMGKEKKIEAYRLKDGSTVTIFKNGIMKMTDSHGRFFTMKEGEPMETVDGQVILMKEGQLYQQIRLKGNLHPNH